MSINVQHDQKKKTWSFDPNTVSVIIQTLFTYSTMIVATFLCFLPIVNPTKAYRGVVFELNETSFMDISFSSCATASFPMFVDLFLDICSRFMSKHKVNYYIPQRLIMLCGLVLPSIGYLVSSRHSSSNLTETYNSCAAAQIILYVGSFLSLLHKSNPEFWSARSVSGILICVCINQILSPYTHSSPGAHVVVVVTYILAATGYGVLTIKSTYMLLKKSEFSGNEVFGLSFSTLGLFFGIFRIGVSQESSLHSLHSRV